MPANLHSTSACASGSGVDLKVPACARGLRRAEQHRFGQRGRAGCHAAEDLVGVLMDRRIVVNQEDAAAIWFSVHAARRLRTKKYKEWVSRC